MNNKVVFITGASSGIGHATAELLLKEDFIVYATARRLEKMKDLEDLGATILYVDVTDQGSIDQCVKVIIAKEGRIDVVFANAGYGCQGPLECVEIDDAKNEFNVNVFGMVRTVKAVLPIMRHQKSGHVIITSSGVGYVSMPGMPWYPASKHAVEALADALRMEVRKFGIKVVKIQPGYIKTEFANIAFKTLDKAAQSKNAAAYEKEIIAFKKHFSMAINEKGAPPATVAYAVLKAINSSAPKREYVPNVEAKLLKLTKRLFGYKVLDWILTKMMFE